MYNRIKRLITQRISDTYPYMLRGIWPVDRRSSGIAPRMPSKSSLSSAHLCFFVMNFNTLVEAVLKRPGGGATLPETDRRRGRYR